MRKVNILDTITARSLTKETLDKIEEHLVKEGVTTEDVVMVMDTCERQLVAVVMFQEKTIPLPLCMSEEENLNLHKLMEKEMNIKRN